jgi:hypothetical protein
MVGKSTCGKGATGSNGNATIPIKHTAAISSDVAIGRSMKGEDILILRVPQAPGAALRRLGYHAKQGCLRDRRFGQRGPAVAGQQRIR